MTDWRALCAMLAAYDTATISNVIELFGVRPQTSGFADKTIRAAYPALPPMVGFAATATCRTTSRREDGQPSRTLVEHVGTFSALSGPAVAVIEDVSQPPAAAIFGEIMCTAYRAFGAVGLVTNGPGRDFEQIGRLRFPVFCDGAVASHGSFHFVNFNVPLTIAGLEIAPDDLIHADRDGLVVVPRHIAGRLPDAAAEYVAAERIILRALQRPAVSVAAYEDALAQAAARINALRARLQNA